MTDDFYSKHLSNDNKPFVKCDSCGKEWNPDFLKALEDKKLCEDCYKFWEPVSPLPKYL